MKLATRLSLIIVLITLGCGITTSLLVSSYTLKTLERRMLDDVDIVVDTLAPHLSDSVINEDMVTTREILHGILSDTRGLDFTYLTDGNGKLLVHTFGKELPPSGLLDKTALKPKVDAKRTFVRFADKGRSYLVGVYPLLEGAKLGNVHVGINPSIFDADIRKLNILILSLSLSVAIAGVFIAIFAAFHVTRPLEQLTRSISEFGGGKTIFSVTENSGLEIKRLSEAFHGMVESRNEAEDALRFQNSLLEAQNATSIDGILIISPERKVIYNNRRFLDIWSIPAVEMAENDTEIIASVLDQIRHKESFLERVQYLYDHPDETSSDEVIFKDGRIIERFSSPIADNAGKTYGRIWFFRDITERKKADDALRESEERFSRLANATWEGIIIHRGGNIMDANESASKMLGCPVEEIIGGNVIAFIAPESIEPTMRKLEEGTTHDQLYLELNAMRKDKTIFPVEALGRPIRYKNINARVLAFRDITDRKRAAMSLQANEARLRAVFDSVQDFIFIKDVNCRYLVINNYFQKRFQIDPSVFLGHTDAEISIFENKDMTVATIRNTDALVLRGETAHYELQHRVCGTLITFDILKTPIQDGQGNITGICGVSRDITERRKVEEEKRSLEERLNRAEKMESLGTLAGGVAHDLNNVLGIVVGYAEMLMDEMDESNPMREDLKKILEGGNRSATIVQDLLTLARRGVHTRKAVNLNTTITDCQKLPEFEKVFSYNTHVKLKTDLESDLLNIIGSPVHLSKTIINLASNAVEAMPNGGVLKIATSNQYLDMPIHGYDNIREGDYVVLTVSDTGEGIRERDINLIFEPFYTKKIMGRSGTGLGLAVVWGTIKDHNGYINVESTEGKGTTFTLYFPVTRDEIASDLISVSMSEYLGRGETILVVDDINRQRELASRMLTKLNYIASTVASGEEAIEYLRKNKADLIVLDMIMDPGIDGLETYEKILEINPVQRAVIVSGFSESDRVKEAQRIGAGAYVPKPYVLERLGIAVRKELDRK